MLNIKEELVNKKIKSFKSKGDELDEKLTELFNKYVIREYSKIM